MRRQAGHVVAVGAVLAALSGCGTSPLGRSVEQAIRVETPGCPGASCELRNDRGRWVVAATPGTVTVITSDRPLEVSCRVPEVTAGSARLPASQPEASGAATAAGAAVGGGLAAATVAPGFVLGGPFAMAAGMVVLVGAASGGSLGHAAAESARPFQYATPVQVLLHCGAADTRPERLAAMSWGLGVRGARPGEDAPDGSVWVTALSPAGRAASAGLHIGDLLLALEGRPLAGTLELQDALASLRAPAVLSVRRGAALLTLTLRPPP